MFKEINQLAQLAGNLPSANILVFVRWSVEYARRVSSLMESEIDGLKHNHIVEEVPLKDLSSEKSVAFR